MNKKTYLKGAGVLLLTAVMLLSATAVTANTTNQISVASPIVNSHNSGMSRDNVIYDNDIIDYTGIMSSQNDTTYGIVSWLADDFTLTSTASVSQIIWIGGYYGSGVYGGMDQRVIIYNDDGSGNKPGTILYIHMFPNAQTNETSLGGYYYSYEVSLPNPPSCNAGVKYWLCIQGEGNIAPQAGTAFHQTPINDHMADFKCTYFGFPDWTDTQTVLGYAADTCFQLLGGTPEDTTPPVTTVGFSGTNPVTVTITATDDMSGVNHTYYNLDAA